MEKIQNFLTWLGRYKDGLSLVVIIPSALGIAGSAAWNLNTWTDQRERELMRPIYEQHIKLTGEISDQLRLMTSSSDPKIVREAAAKFWAIYYGSARQYLTPESYRMLSNIGTFVRQCVDKNLAPEEKPNCSLDKAVVTGFALEARKDLSGRLVNGGLKDMVRIDPVIPREYQK